MPWYWRWWVLCYSPCRLRSTTNRSSVRSNCVYDHLSSAILCYIWPSILCYPLLWPSILCSNAPISNSIWLAFRFQKTYIWQFHLSPNIRSQSTWWSYIPCMSCPLQPGCSWPPDLCAQTISLPGIAYLRLYPYRKQGGYGECPMVPTLLVWCKMKIIVDLHTILWNFHQFNLQVKVHTSLAPRPCAFIADSTKSQRRRGPFYHEHVRPENEPRFTLVTIQVTTRLHKFINNLHW